MQVVMRLGLGAANTIPTDQIIRYPETAPFSKYTFSLWAFPEERWMEILEEYAKFSEDYLRDHGYRCDLLNVGYRVHADDRALLSYSYDGGKVTIDPVSTGSAGWFEFLDAFNVFAHERGGIPLLNQTRGLTYEHIERAYGERQTEMWEAMQRADRGQRFLNGFFRELFEPRRD